MTKTEYWSACFIPSLLLLTTLFTLVLDARKQGGLLRYLTSMYEDSQVPQLPVASGLGNLTSLYEEGCWDLMWLHPLHQAYVLVVKKAFGSRTIVSKKYVLYFKPEMVS